MVSSKKAKEPIPRKLSDREADRPYSDDTSGHGWGSNKIISQFRRITLDRKNKNQNNSACNT